LYAFLCAGLEQCDLLGACCVAQGHVLDVEHRVVAKVRMIVPVLRDQVIDLALKCRSPPNQQRAQDFRPPLVCLVVHRVTPRKWW
jgi:hypothetical protein